MERDYFPLGESLEERAYCNGFFPSTRFPRESQSQLTG